MPLPKNIKYNLDLVPKKTLYNRRLELLDYINENGTFLPNSVLHEDLDRGMLDFVKNELELVVDGVKIPTIDILLTTQNWSQYIETWNFTNSDYNPEPPFISTVRQTEIKFGNMPSLMYTIPNRKQFYYMAVPTWDGNSNGMNIYTIPQPVPIDLNYSVKIICNRMRELNEFNKIIMQKFSSKQAYSLIKGQYVPIVLNDVTSDSKLDISNRKYFHQNYNFTMLGYLIDEKEFQVKPAIERSVAIFETNIKSKSIRRKKPSLENTFDFTFNFDSSGATWNNEIDFRAKMMLVTSDNVSNYSVYINDLFFGNNVNEILISTGDLLRFEITKINNGESAKLLFNNQLS